MKDKMVDRGDDDAWPTAVVIRTVKATLIEKYVMMLMVVLQHL